MILIDTSIWINYFRNSPHPYVALVDRLIQKNEEIATCGVVLTEVLQGVRDEREARILLQLFERMPVLTLDTNGYILAAEIYRKARQSGHTIRRTTDCLIAACAIHHSAVLLHHDKDFDIIAKHSKLKILTTPL